VEDDKRAIDHEEHRGYDIVRYSTPANDRFDAVLAIAGRFFLETSAYLHDPDLSRKSLDSTMPLVGSWS